MSDFIPANSLEVQLRRVITDKNTPSWDFYTPLAAAPLWVIVKHHPELDGSDQVAPAGQNPAVCVMAGKSLKGEDGSWIGIYTSESRAKAAMKRFKISPRDMTCVSAKGHQLLRYLMTFDAELFMNLGVDECQYALDADMIDILLARPEPADPQPVGTVRAPDDDPSRHLGPLKEFLSRQPEVRAAWIMNRTPEDKLATIERAYEVLLVMRDPEDNSLVAQVENMAKALTPVHIEWNSGVMMGEDVMLRRLAEKQPPFYTARGFLED